MVGERENMMGRKGSDIIGDDRENDGVDDVKSFKIVENGSRENANRRPIRIQPASGCVMAK